MPFLSKNLGTVLIFGTFCVSLSLEAQGADIDISVYSTSPQLASPIGHLTDRSLGRDYISTHLPVGFRVTSWVHSAWGFGFDYNSTKLRYTLNGQPETAHLSSWSFQGKRRFDYSENLSPYLGLGIGVSTRSDEESSAQYSDQTREKISGPFSAGMIGAQYEIEDNLSVFSEYKVNYSSEADTDYNFNSGFQFDASNVTQSVNFGIVLSF